MARIFREVAKQALARPPLGALAARTALALGQEHVARRLRLNAGGALPDIVSEALPPDLFAQGWLQMDSAGGRDQVARCLWTHGWSHFERPLPQVFAKLARLSRGVADIGANTGFYSLLAAAANPRARVLAFEPLAPVAALARRNAELNAADNVEVVETAAGAEDAMLTLYVTVDDHGLVETSASLNPAFRAAHSATLSVPVRTLDQLCGDADIDLIKIDVETLEATVLDGARRLIARCRPVIVVELLDKDPRLAGMVAEFDYVPVLMRVRDGLVLCKTLAPDLASQNILLWPRERSDSLSVFARTLAGR